MEKITIIGAGGMGCALAAYLAAKGIYSTIYTPFADEASSILEERENSKKLPGILLDPGIVISDDKISAFNNAGIVLVAVPSRVMRHSLEYISDSLDKNAIFVCCSKGIEAGTHYMMSQVIEDVIKTEDIVILSGPSHAEELARNVPTAMIAASKNRDLAVLIQDLFISESLRIYTSDDVSGVELAGALKNVIALCAGIADGLGYGDNTKAALMTRGMLEIARLGARMGAKRETFFGLAGIGDLIVTCTSMHSRNRRAGIRIGEGMDIEEAIKSIQMTVEGYDTCKPAYELSLKYQVPMPITEALFRIINKELDVRTAVSDLMTRDKKDEFSDL